MTPVLQEQLEIVLRDEYRVIRELGGGGMSHVFLAEDVALGRNVVIKVLTPELAAGVNRERFQREIKLLATLQHPLLVTVLAAGEGDGLVWYSMPFVEGESLRDRIRRGPLPPREALAIIADAAQGLAAAHARGVVHRDVKPENVLLSGGRAIVADFGIAKALSEASTAQAGLTATGIAVGTPAYMAPEQAAGDPDVDARADVYALGCVAYELLSGSPPFEAPTPAQLLMAHVVQPPQPLVERAPGVDPAIADVVMRALAKDAAARWPTAQGFADAIEEVRYGGSGERTATRGTRATATPAPAAPPPRQRLAFVAGFALLAGATGWTLARGGVVPGWARDATFGFVVVLLAIVAVLWKAGSAPQVARLVRASAVAAALLVAAVAGHGVLRAAGVGPFASIISSGKLAENDRLLIAEFANRTGDAVLGDLVTDALRTDLQQSRTVRVLARSDVQAALARMQKPGVALDSALAFQLAQREGVPAVLLGSIARLGKTIVISTRLVTPQGDELAGFRETAESEDGVIDAVDRLSKAMRGKLGESLRSVAGAPRLADVTTGSIDALRKYTEAIRVGELPGSLENFEKELALLEEAVRLDSTFAMAWRRLGVRVYGKDPVKGNAAITRAYQQRERLGPVERSLAEASYHTYVAPDHPKQRAAYEAVLAADSGNRIALNNLAKLHFDEGRWTEALAVSGRFLALDSTVTNAWVWYLHSLWALGRDAEYRRGWATLQRRTGGDAERIAVPYLDELQTTGRWRDVAPYADSVEGRLRDASMRASLQAAVANTDYLLGRLGSGRRRLARAYEVFTRADTSLRRRLRGTDERLDFYDAAWLRGDIDEARRLLPRFIAAAGMETLPVYERSVANLAFDYAIVGDAATARRRLAAYWAARRAAGTDTARYLSEGTAFTQVLESQLLLAEGKPQDAVRLLRAVADSGKGSDVVSAGFVGFAWRQAGQPDSALAAFRRWITVRDPRKYALDQNYYVTPRALREGCALADEVGDVASRRFFCERLVDLWRDADPALQPVVADAKARLAREAGRPVGR